jgi:capsular exopolysaccharide synthesis family protein
MDSPRIETSAGQVPALPGGPVAEATSHLPRIDPGRWFGILRRRGWLVVVTIALALAATSFWLARAPKVYQSHGSVYVSTEAPRLLDIRAVAPEESRDLEQLRSVADGMLSSTLLLRVIESSHLANDFTFTEKPLSRQGLLEKLRKAVDVELRRGTRIIDITVDDTDPTRAQLLVESIKNEYESWSDERRESLTRTLSEGLAQEESRLHAQMEASAEKLQRYRELNAVPGLEAEGAADVMSGGFEDLRLQLTRARAERLRIEAEVEAFEGFDAGDPDALAGLADSEHAAEVMALMRSLRAKQTEFARIKERYLHKHPVYREVASEIAGLEQSLASAVSSAGEALQKRHRVAMQNEGKLVAEVEESRGRVVDAEGVRARFVALSREADADRELHATVSRRLQETSLAASAPSSILRWEETPLAPEKAAKPRNAITLGLAGCGGLMLGLLLMLGAEIGDRRVRNTDAAARVAGVPVLARVPAAEFSADSSIVIHSDPGSDAAEAFRRLRAVLGFSGPEEETQTYLFTGARDGEGSSFCALNYAASLAMQGYRTLLIDADMRGTGLSGESAPGLAEFLSAKAAAADGCLLTELPKLCLFASGGVRSDAAELLAGTRFPALLEDAYRWFDRVVIDVPAVLSASDVQAVARYADHTCLVVHGNSIDRRSLQRSAEMLRSAGARLTGIVWNEFSAGAGRGASCHVKPTRPEAVRSILAATEPMPTKDTEPVTPPMPTKAADQKPGPMPRLVSDLEVA